MILDLSQNIRCIVRWYERTFVNVALLLQLHHIFRIPVSFSKRRFSYVLPAYITLYKMSTFDSSITIQIRINCSLENYLSW